MLQGGSLWPPEHNWGGSCFRGWPGAAEALGSEHVASAVALLEVEGPHLKADDAEGEAGGQEADDGDEEPAMGFVPEVCELAAEALTPLAILQLATADRILDGIVQPVDRTKIVIPLLY